MAISIKEKGTQRIHHYFEEDFVDVSNQLYPFTAEELFYLIATKQTH